MIFYQFSPTPHPPIYLGGGQPVSAGTTVVGYNFTESEFLPGDNYCAKDYTSYTFTTTLDGNLASNIQEVIMVDSGTTLTTSYSTTMTFNGNFSGSPELDYVLSPNAQGDIATQLTDVQGYVIGSHAAINWFDSGEIFFVFPYYGLAYDLLKVAGGYMSPTPTPTTTTTPTATSSKTPMNTPTPTPTP